ncbi:hypothetical protein PHYSODRAFT_500984 [Phytophthora sojae]|uniref:Uncharacterized protein n=1 Tax=Phytophthora sojae (strain P6497) TaxID=1094619 RepID=G4ZDL8_PHYSP|nr:hypothetical protein PHYSODRAFT_500984 [Phytophthora sojae]EGZ18357.1 hypothetical protein PHYSODRAFT_500984 [Phytophthora sojae]|eukprot:XP_009527415.1 hypothetical protein PHYSODRAFT_500984 [Phytophthora sojae]
MDACGCRSGKRPSPSLSSDMGLAVLNPSANEFIQIAFDSEETKWIMADSKSNTFSINVREHMCIALALWIWGSTWTSLDPDRTVVVKCWSDNRAAVAWSNSLASTNELSQEVNRAIGLAEVLFNVRVIASHLPGSTNIAADAASRAWVSPFSEIWTNFSSSWKQEALSNLLQDLQSQSLAQSSRVKYATTWHQWQEWCNMLGFSIWLLPQTELHSYQLVLFGVHCWKFGWNYENKGNATSTVVSKISHISWHHRRVLGYSVGLSDRHKLALNGMRRQDAKSSRKSPVTVALLRIMHKSLDFSQPRHRVIGGGCGLGGFPSTPPFRISSCREKGLRVHPDSRRHLVHRQEWPVAHLTRSRKLLLDFGVGRTTNTSKAPPGQ